MAADTWRVGVVPCFVLCSERELEELRELKQDVERKEKQQAVIIEQQVRCWRGTKGCVCVPTPSIHTWGRAHTQLTLGHLTVSSAGVLIHKQAPD